MAADPATATSGALLLAETLMSFATNIPSSFIKACVSSFTLLMATSPEILKPNFPVFPLLTKLAGMGIEPEGTELGATLDAAPFDGTTPDNALA